MKVIWNNFIFAALLLVLGTLTAAAAEPSCRQSAGDQVSQQLVRQCLAVSPATHPPCNALNPCNMIVDEIRRGCTMIPKDKMPSFCTHYTRY
jgi:hypothetical protein